MGGGHRIIEFPQGRPEAIGGPVKGAVYFQVQ